MQYVIRFQNTGNYRADNVRILDTLSGHLDKSTLRIISKSHPMEWRISQNGILDFYFDNIFLPDSNQNELLSHGFVKYGIKVNKDFTKGESIKNTAHIFFDFNEAVVTNTAVTFMDFPASTRHIPLNKNAILVYPNPTSGEITLHLNDFEKGILLVKVMDITGKIVNSSKINSTNAQLHLNGTIPAIYMGLVTDLNGKSLGNFKFILK